MKRTAKLELLATPPAVDSRLMLLMIGVGPQMEKYRSLWGKSRTNHNILYFVCICGHLTPERWVLACGKREQAGQMRLLVAEILPENADWVGERRICLFWSRSPKRMPGGMAGQDAERVQIAG